MAKGGFRGMPGGMNQAALRLKFLEIGPDIALSDYYLVQLNVKGFKLINERYGSEEADGILRYIYQVLDRNIDRHKNEFAARSGSDHFTLCLKESRREDKCGLIKCLQIFMHLKIQISRAAS